MLDCVLEFAEKKGLVAEPGFESKDVRWALVFSAGGEFLEVIELGDPSDKKNRGKTFPQCPHFSQPEMTAGGELKAHFLVETAEVVALLARDRPGPKAGHKHDYFVGLLEKVSSIYAPLEAVALALKSEETLSSIRTRLQALKARPTDKVTIRIGDEYPVMNQVLMDWFREFRQTVIPGRQGPARKMRCFLSGELVECARTHPKIKGLAGVGGMATGDVLIGFDKAAFESYGLSQSENAAMSEKSASAYSTALNYLIQHNSGRLADTLVVHWYKDEVDPTEDPLDFIMEASEQHELEAVERARRLLNAIKRGERPKLAGNRYYAMTLSGAAGRTMVRDWMEGSFEELAANVDAWFSDLLIVNRYGDAPARGPKFYAVLASTVRDINNSPPPAPFIAKMWRAAVRGELLPLSALSAALERFRVDVVTDQPFNHAGIGLIKAFNIRKQRFQGGCVMNLEPYLNEEHPEAAYHCGRLMAVLAGLQRSAVGDVGAGVVQRFYAAASTTPSLVLGRLTKTAQFHLGKLDPGLARWYEDKLSDICSRLGDGVPRTLDLEEQSLFAMGYYQQLAEMRRKKVVVPEEESVDEKEVDNE